MSEESCSDLSIEQSLRNRAARLFQNLEVLGGSVDHRKSIAVHQRFQGLEVDRQRINQDNLVAPGDLHQRHSRPVALFPMEFGIEGVAVLLTQDVDGGVQVVVTVDYPIVGHVAC